MKWILIILATTLQSESVSVESAAGFSSELECLRAAEQVKLLSVDGIKIRTSCIGVE